MSRRKRRENPAGQKILGFIGAMLIQNVVSGIMGRIDPPTKDNISTGLLAASLISFGMGKATDSDRIRGEFERDTLTGAKWSFYIGGTLGALGAFAAPIVLHEAEQSRKSAASQAQSMHGCSCQNLSGSFTNVPYNGMAGYSGIEAANQIAQTNLLYNGYVGAAPTYLQPVAVHGWWR